jgi:hypothetical protein
MYKGWIMMQHGTQIIVGFVQMSRMFMPYEIRVQEEGQEGKITRYLASVLLSLPIPS